ncbi:prosaposin-like isoform X2 [Carcharodon carcharias]|uniref:prosaposin-like isoform X2 n=1 Tax=Carcharodon carcharias TaxID=13397 RepID=UPI001B7E0C2C|nr:prosaposin-like isoform X2 [Carcharodon carcharias]
MALFLFLVFVSFSPALAKFERTNETCPQDRINQCQDLQVAVQCRVLSDCLETEWREPKVDDNICEECKKFIAHITDMLKDKAVQDALKAALHKGCDLIPIKELKEQCNKYVDSYLSIIIQLLEKEVKPDVVCAALGLCKSRQQVHAQKSLSNAIPVDEPSVVNYSPLYNASQKHFQGPLPKGVFSCEFCLLIMKKLKHLLPEEKTESVIIKLPSKVCSQLPSKYFTKCHNLMEKRGEAAVELLFKKLTPSGVCDTLRLCSRGKKDSMLPIMSCDMCENVVHQLKSARKQGTEVDVLLPKACNSYSDVSNLMCEDFIHSHKAQLSNLLQNQEDKDLCGELDFCVRKVEAKLLGRDECTWGPSHWCQTWEIATRCEAVEYCEEYGWI